MTMIEKAQSSEGDDLSMDLKKVGVIGVGHLGQHHARVYTELLGAQLAGVVDQDENRAMAIGEGLGVPWFTDTDEFLDAAHPDAVSVVVPTSMHFEIAKKVLLRGINVLIEKPVTTTVREAEDLLRIAADSDLVLQVGHIERFNSAVQYISKIVKNPLFLQSRRLGPYSPRINDVGVVLDLMIHDIDIILTLVDSPIESMEAVGVPVLTDTVDIANARIRFASGCIANLTASRVSAETMRKIRMFQSNAYLSIDFAKAAVDVYTLDENRRIGHRHLAMSESDALAAEIRSFIDAVKGLSEVKVDGIAGLRAIETALAIKDSMIIPER